MRKIKASRNRRYVKSSRYGYDGPYGYIDTVFDIMEMTQKSAEMLAGVISTKVDIFENDMDDSEIFNSAGDADKFISEMDDIRNNISALRKRVSDIIDRYTTY